MELIKTINILLKYIIEKQSGINSHGNANPQPIMDAINKSKIRKNI